MSFNEFLRAEGSQIDAAAETAETTYQS